MLESRGVSYGLWDIFAGMVSVSVPEMMLGFATTQQNTEVGFESQSKFFPLSFTATLARLKRQKCEESLVKKTLESEVYAKIRPKY